MGDTVPGTPVPMNKQRKFKLTVASFVSATLMTLSGLLGPEYVVMTAAQWITFVLVLLGVYGTANVAEKRK